MEPLKFKTNINCNACVASITPDMNNADGICKWEVDTSSKDKILTVFPGCINPDSIIETVKKSGYKIEQLK